jgi:hypothetical protein
MKRVTVSLSVLCVSLLKGGNMYIGVKVVFSVHMHF